jgi:programmed cell death 6-interacting protein
LREKGEEYRQKIDSANHSNSIVRSKIDANLFLIEHLTMDRQELEASIPASTTSSTLALKDPNLKLLKGYLDSLNKNIKQRPEILARLKKISEGDDIGPRLTKSALGSLDVDEAALFKEQLQVYAADIQLISNLIAEQEKLLELIYVVFLVYHRIPIPRL